MKISSDKLREEIKSKKSKSLTLAEIERVIWKLEVDERRQEELKNNIDLLKKSQSQADYCWTNKLPLFAPNDGICWSCHKQIYDRITEQEAKNKHITGCPMCCRSYCD